MLLSPNPSRRRVALAAALVLAAVAAPAAQADPVSVKLRVEGRTGTTYEKAVTTDGHDVTTASGGTHKCDGTNGGANPSPGATSTAALDDGAKQGGFSFDATWFDSFEDFLVDRIGPDAATSSEFWGQYKNFVSAQVGGCQDRVGTGDEVLWVYDAFSKAHALKLAGPTAAQTGQSFGVRVTDGGTGAPLSGASIGGKLTDADGRAALSFAKAGVYRLKATRADSVRSQLLTVCVDPPGAPACTSGDTSSPSVELLAAGASGGYASDRFTSRNIGLSWQGDDGAGSGVAAYDVDVRDIGSGARASVSDWRSLLAGTTKVSTRFRGRSGHRYEFRVTAIDRAGNRRSATGNDLLIPVDDRDRSLIHFSKGWKRLQRTGAWGRHVVRSQRRNATATLRFRGSQLALIGRRLPKGGKLRVKIDGGSRTVRLRGKPRHRRVLFTSKGLRSGLHRARLTAVGGGPVELDAVAIKPTTAVSAARRRRPPVVEHMVVFRDGSYRARRTGTRGARVKVGRRRCAVATATPLAALVRARPSRRIGIKDFGSCGRHARDADQLLVRRIGPDANRDDSGWVYKVGRKAATAGAGNSKGPFGHGRLRRGLRVTWFYCLHASDCQRTLALRVTTPGGGAVSVRVTAYDDEGKGIHAGGAEVRLGNLTAIANADGLASFNVAPGRYGIRATRAGEIRTYPQRVTVH